MTDRGPAPADRVSQAYGERAAEYLDLLATTAAVHHDDLALVSRHLSIPSGPVLDVGCGPGHLTGHLHSLAVDATGVDRVPAFLHHARAHHPAVPFVRASMAQLPVPDGSIAGLLAWYSLIHLPPEHLDGTLAELRRAAAPGAPLVAGFFDGDEVVAFDHAVVTAWYWPAEELAARLRRAGFEEVDREQRPGTSVAGARPHGAIVAVAC